MLLLLLRCVVVGVVFKICCRLCFCQDVSLEVVVVGDVEICRCC